MVLTREAQGKKQEKLRSTPGLSAVILFEEQLLLCPSEEKKGREKMPAATTNEDSGSELLYDSFANESGPVL